MSQKLYDNEREFLTSTAAAIRWTAKYADFDHRNFIGNIWAREKPIHKDTAELPQGRLIYAIGKVLQPKTVYEVGIGPGITSHSLFSACPQMNYFGLDDLSADKVLGAPAVVETIANLSRRGTVQVAIADSDIIDKFEHPAGKIDLIHIDGDHSYDHQLRDVEKAIRSKASWLLVDDCNDTEAATACFAAWRNELHKAWRGGLLPFIYFEDSRTGSILFHLGMWDSL